MMIKTCKITPKEVLLNGENQNITLDREDWKKQLYEYLDLGYSKFFKMDDLSKMSLLGLRFLSGIGNFGDHANDKISLIFSNCNSSSYTDEKFISSYRDNGTPSPTLFVYTLPNITTGEICNFMKWYGETTFIIAENFHSVPFEDLMRIEFTKGATACLCGWVNKTKESEECFLFFVEENMDHYNNQNILNLFNQ